MTDPDRTEDWLRKGLARAVPDPPGEPGRAEAARGRARRARRRTTLVAAAGVVATLAVVGVVTTTLRDGSSQDDTAAAPSSPYDAPACPAEDRAGSGLRLEADPSAPPEAPPNAISVRMCQGPGTPVDVPADALVTDVDEMVSTVNDLEETTTAPESCRADFGPGYRLVFGYDDGRTFVITGELHGCKALTVGSTFRADSHVPWDRFFELLRGQRGQLDPRPLQAAPDGCDATYETTPSATPLGRPEDLAVAALCTVDGTGGSAKRAEVSSEDLDRLVSDIVAHTVSNAPVVDCPAKPPFVRIVGLTAWGDRVTLRDGCLMSSFRADGDVSSKAWQPGPEGRALLERLISEAR